MKKIFITLLVLFFSCIHGFTQDIITQKSGEDIKTKIMEVTQTEVKYKKYDNLTGPTFTMAKADILMVRYENGTKDIFNVEPKASSNTSNSSNSSNATSTQNTDDLHAKGQIDATRYYTGYKGAGTGTLIASLVSPLIGLVPAIACSSSQPKDENLMYPSSELMKQPDYNNGYTTKAKKIKSGKVWMNWGIGFGVNLALVLILLSGSSGN